VTVSRWVQADLADNSYALVSHGDCVMMFFSHCLLVDNIGGLREGTVTFEEVAAPPMTLSADTTVSDASDQFQA
jgi:hypothetical protein